MFIKQVYFEASAKTINLFVMWHRQHSSRRWVEDIIVCMSCMDTSSEGINPFPAKDKYICLLQKLYLFKEGVCT